MSDDTLRFNPESAISKVRILAIQGALRGQSLSISEISDMIGVCKKYAQMYVTFLKKRGDLHITEYRAALSDRGYVRGHAIYAWGDGINADRYSYNSAANLLRSRSIISEEMRQTAGRKHTSAAPRKDESQFWIPQRG